MEKKKLWPWKNPKQNVSFTIIDTLPEVFLMKRIGNLKVWLYIFCFRILGTILCKLLISDAPPMGLIPGTALIYFSLVLVQVFCPFIWLESCEDNVGDNNCAGIYHCIVQIENANLVPIATISKLKILLQWVFQQSWNTINAIQGNAQISLAPIAVGGMLQFLFACIVFMSSVDQNSCPIVCL